MSDTTTSAVEVMGSTPGGNYAQDAEGGWQHVVSAVPTPDDMLAWLRGRGWVLCSAWEDDCGAEDQQVDPYIAVEFTDRKGNTITVAGASPHGQLPSAPTLHAALEAAIIAVGRAG